MNPTEVGERVTNSLGQEIAFYEDPMNPAFCVIAACHQLQVAAHTEFFDTNNFGKDSEYNPVFIEGKLKCEYEL